MWRIVLLYRRLRRSSEAQGKQTAEQQQPQPQVATVAAFDDSYDVYEEIDMEANGYSIPNFSNSCPSLNGDYDQLEADAPGLTNAWVYQSTPVYYNDATQNNVCYVWSNLIHVHIDDRRKCRSGA